MTNVIFIKDVSELPIASEEVKASGVGYISVDGTKQYKLQETIFLDNNGKKYSEWVWLISDKYPEWEPLAHELLAALEHLLNDYEREWGSEFVDDYYPDVRSAIIKAKGLENQNV